MAWYEPVSNVGINNPKAKSSKLHFYWMVGGEVVGAGGGGGGERRAGRMRHRVRVCTSKLGAFHGGLSHSV